MRYADRTVDFEAALRDLGNPSPRVRASAADALGSAEIPEHASRAREALRAALHDERAEVRYAASLSLGELHDGEALDALC
jgi:HEAT repeat protein